MREYNETNVKHNWTGGAPSSYSLLAASTTYDHYVIVDVMVSAPTAGYLSIKSAAGTVQFNIYHAANTTVHLRELNFKMPSGAAILIDHSASATGSIIVKYIPEGTKKS